MYAKKDVRQEHQQPHYNLLPASRPRLSSAGDGNDDAEESEEEESTQEESTQEESTQEEEEEEEEGGGG